MKKTEQKKHLNALKEIKKQFLDDDQVQGACELLELKLLQFPLEEQQQEGLYPIPSEIINKKGVALFSDGACRGNPGPGAWGFIVQENSGDISWEESDFTEFTTNNKMELSGAIFALKYLVKQNRVSENIFLFTDSTYVVKGITEWVKGWKARGWKKADRKAPENLELWQELDMVSNNFSDLHYKWVKGHSGHPQNERCDTLANEALDEAGF